MKKGDAIKFKRGCVYYFGVVTDACDNEFLDIDYAGSKKAFLRLNDGWPLNFFGHIHKSEAIKIGTCDYFRSPILIIDQ
jgi:hypothetical protein